MKDIITYFMMLGALSNGNALPFWAVSNQYGLMPDSNGALFMAGAESSFDDSKTFQWRWGINLASNVSKKEFKFIPDELYLSMKMKSVPFTLDLGYKHQPMEFTAGSSFGTNRTFLGTLSTTAGHLIWSSNSRTLPGYAINLEPVAVPFTNRHIWLYGAYGDYFTTDKRYCNGELIHSTKIFMRTDFNDHFSFHLGLDHYAVWGGDKGYVKPTFNNYLRLITGRCADADGTESDQLNVIGDQGGGEMFKLEYDNNRLTVVAQHEIPYSDGSGMGFKNFPDGINTISVSFKDKERWISDILFEYGYTRFQSGSIHIEVLPVVEGARSKGKYSTGCDDYFNNSEYKDGWIYYGRMIGCPLFFPESPDENGLVLGVRNNRLSYHHFALAGKLFRKSPYKLMLTQSLNYGTYKKQYAGESAFQKEWGSVKETGLSQFSLSLSGEIPLNKNLDVLYGLYDDFGQIFENNFGASLGIKILLQ